MTGPRIVEFPLTPLSDVPRKLRETADAIERGDYGPVGSCAVVLMGNTMEVFGFGSDSTPSSAAMLLQAGAHRLINAIANHGRE